MIGIGPNLAYQPAVTRYSSGADLEFDFTKGSIHPIEGAAALVVTRAGDTATQFNAAGVLEVCAADTARLQHDPATLEFENMFTWSEQLDNAAWNKTATSVSLNAAIAADGKLTADKLIEDATGGTSHSAYRTVSAVSGTQYCVAFFCKKGERDRVNLTFSSFNGVFAEQTVGFDVLNGTVASTSGAIIGSGITHLWGGWYLCWAAATAAATATALYSFKLHNGTSSTYTGDGTSGLYLWGAQLNTGPTALAYRPTQATAQAKQYACDGLLVEDAAVNSIRNNTMVGAVAGTPGTLPTNWSIALAAGLASEVVSVGTDSGIEYVDVRCFGTATGTTGIACEAFNQIVATSGQAWAMSFYAKLVAGSLANITSVQARIREALSDSTFVANTVASFTPSASGLVTQRASTTLASAAATTQRISGGIFINSTGAIDITLRIGLPQLERDKVTTVIKTAGAAVTRNADTPDGAIGPWYNQTEGTVVVEWDAPITTRDTNALFAFNKAGTTETIAGRIGYSGTRKTRAYAQTSGGAFTYALDGATNVSTTGKLAVAWASTNDFSVSDTGMAAVSDSSGSLSGFAIDNLQIGRNGTSRLNGTIKRFAYWRTRKSSADLPQMSA